MAIEQFPEHIAMQSACECVICKRRIGFDIAAAGIYNIRGELVFLCAGHFWNEAEFISGLADYMANERYTQLSGGAEPIRGLQYARPIY